MAGATLDLSALQALIALGGYGGRGFYEPSTAVVGLSAALFLSDLSIWQGAGDTLTDAEIDDIQEFAAQLESDMMTTGDMYAIDKVSITASADIAVSPGVDTTIHFDVDVYDPETMHGTGANDHRINVVRDGLHLIDASLHFSNTAPGRRGLYLYKYGYPGPNHRIIRASIVQNVTATSETILGIAAQDEAVIGEYYYLVVNHTASGVVQVKARDSSPFFSVVRL